MNVGIHCDRTAILEEILTYGLTSVTIPSFSFFCQSYASILYLKLPYNFRIILRGKDVEHHNIVNDMMLTKEVTYRPLHLPEGIPKDVNVMLSKLSLGISIIFCFQVYKYADFSFIFTDDCQCHSWFCKGCAISY